MYGYRCVIYRDMIYLYIISNVNIYTYINKSQLSKPIENKNI